MPDDKEDLISKVSNMTTTDADMRAFGASDEACYRWPDDTDEHKALRAAFIAGAAAVRASRDMEDTAAFKLLREVEDSKEKPIDACICRDAIAESIRLRDAAREASKLLSAALANQ